MPGSGAEAGLPGRRLPAGDAGEAAFQAAPEGVHRVVATRQPQRRASVTAEGPLPPDLCDALALIK
jgi:hypothetical protein